MTPQEAKDKYDEMVAQTALELYDKVTHMIEEKAGISFDDLLALAKAYKEGRIVIKEAPPDGK